MSYPPAVSTHAEPGVPHGRGTESPPLDERWPAQRSGSSKGEVSFSDYLRLVLKHRVIFLSVAGVLVLLTAVFIALKAPTYKATATLKVSIFSPLLPNEHVEDGLAAQSRTDEYINTLIEQLKSRSVGMSALTRAEVAPALEKETPATPAPDAAQLAPEALQERQLQGFLSRLEIRPLRRTTLIQVSAVGKSPENAALFANALSESFIEFLRQERQDVTKEKLLFLQAQANELDGKVGAVEKEISDYAREHSIVTLDKDQTSLLREYSDINHLLTEAIGDRLKSEAVLGTVKGEKGAGLSAADGASLTEVRESLKDAEAEYAALSQKFNDEYPRMAELKARIASLRKQAEAGLRAQFRSQRDSEKKLAEQLRDVGNRLFELSQDQVQYRLLEGQYDSLKDLRQTVLRQIEAVRLSSDSRDSNVIFSERAKAPVFPAGPRRLFIVVVSLLVAPVAAFSVVLVIDLLDSSVKSPEELDTLLGLPNLGSVPAFKIAPVGTVSRFNAEEIVPVIPLLPAAEEHEPSADISPQMRFDALRSRPHAPQLKNTRGGLVTLAAPSSITAEAFRTIRTSILLSTPDRPPKIILLASAKSGEGKSTVLANLAVGMAQVLDRVVVIESDLRRPNLRRFFQYPEGTPGLVDFLAGQATVDEIVHPTQLSNMFIVPAGSRPPNPGELIASKQMSTLIEILKGEFDFVLLDSPPILAVADALTLSRHVEGTIVVCRVKHSDRSSCRRAVTRLQSVGSKTLGAILNSVEPRQSEHYRWYSSDTAEVVDPQAA